MMILETIHTVKRSAYADRIEVENSGWIGFTDHFWMATLIPEQNNRFRSTAKYYDKSDIFQAETVFSPRLWVQDSRQA